MMALLLLACGLSPLAAESPAGWYQAGADLVSERKAARDSVRPARNVILFVGDGMSLATVSAARILEGQMRGETGEDNTLYFEQFPHLALAKTYNTDQQTPDSAGTMTAMMTGVKTFAGAIAVDQLAGRGDCESSHGQELVTLLDLANLAGMTTGVVTTTRITHATPAATFSRVPDRRWEADSSLPPSARVQGCRDIARQLIEYDLGDGIDVVLGGGRRTFLPRSVSDPEYAGVQGLRDDGRNLIEIWQDRYPQGRYVWNQAQFDAIPNGFDGPVLGLFEPGHMQYEHDRADDLAGEPSIAEMTRRAVEMLKARGNGFFLMVEGGRIDHAHHINNAHRALTDTIAFADAVRVAHQMTSERDTLIIVTADHGHSLAFGGYAARGNPITGLAARAGEGEPEDRLMRDRLGDPMTVLTYYNGPGFRGGKRPDYRRVDPEHPDFRQEATVWTGSSTHSGEDVPVYSTGPGAEVLYGVVEQNVLFHAMLQAVPALHQLSLALASDDRLPDWRAINSYRVESCKAAQMLTIGEC